VWDLRAQQLVAVVSGSGGAATKGAARSAGSSGARAASATGGVPQVTAAAWLGGGVRGDFATGHANGEVLVWALPEAKSGADEWNGSGTGDSSSRSQPPRSVQQMREGAGAAGGSSALPAAGAAPLQPRLLSRLRVVQQSASAVVRSVVSMQYLVTGRKESLLVFGGQEVDRLDGLAVLTLPLPTEVRIVWGCMCVCTGV